MEYGARGDVGLPLLAHVPKRRIGDPGLVPQLKGLFEIACLPGTPGNGPCHPGGTFRRSYLDIFGAGGS